MVFLFMQPEMTIIRIKQNNIKMLQRLHASSFRHGWDVETFRTFLHDPHSIGFASCPVGQPQKLIGFVLARLVSGEAEILSIAVDPGQRRNGIGYALMDALLRHLYQVRAETLFLEVDEHNHAARALYKRFGFTQTGRRSGYYQSRNRRTDALILRRNFTHTF